MSVTLKDILVYLRNLDEISILEALDITTEDILERFEDKVEERFEILRKDFETEIYDEDNGEF